MDWLSLLVAFLFALAGLACLVLVLVGLPGTWLMIALAVVVELFDRYWTGSESFVTHGWPVFGVCVVLAGVGEVLEAGAGAAGTRAGGGTRRGMVGAIVGGIVGAIVLTPLIPIPVLGTVLGAVIGTFVGAVVAELTHERAPGARGALRAGSGAAVGRVLGTMGKTLTASIVWVVLTVSAFRP
jgi:uncharacterized protein YqgC (DUF456 family)